MRLGINVSEMGIAHLPIHGEISALRSHNVFMLMDKPDATN